MQWFCVDPRDHYPRSKGSAFPVHRSAHFHALQLFASLKVHCTSLSSALHSPLKYTLRCGSVLAAYALQRSCSALKYLHCKALPMHCRCAAFRSGYETKTQLLIKADRPHLCYYPLMSTDYRNILCKQSLQNAKHISHVSQIKNKEGKA